MKQGFNLLKAQVEPPTVWGKIYDWVVGTARLIVIIVEIIVVVAFAIRLVIDIQSAELDKEIIAKENQITLFRESGAIDNFRQIQMKTTSFRYAWEESVIYSKVYVEINSYLPTNFIEGNVSIDGDYIVIMGKASISEIGDLEGKIKGSPTFKNVEFKNLETQGSSTDEIGEFIVSGTIRDLEYRKIY